MGAAIVVQLRRFVKLGYDGWLFRSLMVAMLSCLLACSDPKQEIVGKWVSNQASLLTLQFYKDGTASLSSTGFFNLRWQTESDSLIRIEALDKKLYFNFRILKDQKGSYGMLELPGASALEFRKAQN
jgi:hypothetical protein